MGYKIVGEEKRCVKYILNVPGYARRPYTLQCFAHLYGSVCLCAFSVFMQAYFTAKAVDAQTLKTVLAGV